MSRSPASAEQARLDADGKREANWKRWGPYLSERQWGTVREDYSPDGSAWTYFPHTHARSRAYRWGEDGLLGITDRECRLCFAWALWNGRDPILKERLFGLTNEQGNHGEDVKEVYHFLDATPTSSYLKALYRYPLAEYPYRKLIAENRARGLNERELELEDTDVFEGRRFVDAVVEYAKASPDDVRIRLTLVNPSDAVAELTVLPTLWFRNTWSWGNVGEEGLGKPSLEADGESAVRALHPTLGHFRLELGPTQEGVAPRLVFTENETNVARIFAGPNPTPHVKDAFHELIVHGREEAVNPAGIGTKAAAVYLVEIPAGGQVTISLRLRAESAEAGPDDEEVFEARRREADEFYAARSPAAATDDEKRVLRQGWAGLLWSKQFMYYVVKDWLDGDPGQPSPPAERREGRNAEWRHLHNRDVISMPDAWEYPWYAAWDLAFHTVAFAGIDPQFAKDQLVLMLREWYMHPNGQIPAYEWAFGDVNPPVHAWACWRVYKMTGEHGVRDRLFLARTFQKLVLNFTWWVNRKDQDGQNLFAGGFLGLDNIGVFDRSRPLPTGGRLEQADGTAWMAFYCATMLSMALELARHDPAYEDMASKFFEHFVAIADAMNELGGTGLWDEEAGFYHDRLSLDGEHMPLRVRSMVGLVPLFAVEVLADDVIARLPGFRKRLEWFLEHRKDLARQISYLARPGEDAGKGGNRLLAIPSRERLERVLRCVFDEAEFLGPHGIRSLSRAHLADPFVLTVEGRDYRVAYEPGESRSRLFGGNSNWRGPVWFPMNFLLIESLERYHHVYGDSLTVEVPAGSGRRMNLQEAAREISRRLVGLFLPDAAGRRPCFGDHAYYDRDPAWRDLLLFHEYFDGDTGRGLGACHQTGWTALVVKLVQDLARPEVRTRPG